MRLYLDTNILIFTLLNPDELTMEVKNEILDYKNILLTSTVCVEEMIHLCQIGKLDEGGQKKKKKKQSGLQAEDIVQKVRDARIEIVPVSEQHLETYATLPLEDDHRDPNDRLIIAQAITDRITLISSDRKFEWYKKHGLDFLFNER